MTYYFLDVADEDAKCYKAMGPILINQTLTEAKETVTKRSELMKKEQER
jgi:chaperonin cofactor prefoldin